MSTQKPSKTPIEPPLAPGFNIISRSDSLASVSGSTSVDKELLAQALDKIHNSASHSKTLTTFNEFASPPSASYNESKSIAGDFMQNGLSGLYSRFRGVVGSAKEKNGSTHCLIGRESLENSPKKIKKSPAPLSKVTILQPREDSANVSTISSARVSIESPTIQFTMSSSFAGQFLDGQSQILKSSKSSFGSTATSTPATVKSTSSGKLSIASITKVTTSSAAVPTVAPITINAFKDDDVSRASLENSIVDSKITTKPNSRNHSTVYKLSENRLNRKNINDSSVNDELKKAEATPVDAVGATTVSDPEPLAGENIEKGPKSSGSNAQPTSVLSSLWATEVIRAASSGVSNVNKRPGATDFNTQPNLSNYQSSRASTDHGTVETSPIHLSAHNSVIHESSPIHEIPQSKYLGKLWISGTTTNEGAPEVVNARLEQMRKQVLSKEFWMADEICKECFLCGDTFSAFRRKHHCRTCGCIFDFKCTSIVSGQRFGVQGSLKVCNTCLDIINRRHDSSASEDSTDDSTLPTFFPLQQTKYGSNSQYGTHEGLHSPFQESEVSNGNSKARSIVTPMMAIPATRRIGDSKNRHSAVLEIDIPQLSRPSSSRSVQAHSTVGRPPSSGHKRHHSKHNFVGRFKNATDERPPFHRGINDDSSGKSNLPAFHDDNIIDPDLAPYLSDEGSSADEQMSIFATLNQSNAISSTLDNDRIGFGSSLNSGKKHRTRTGEKSITGFSLTSRNLDEFIGNTTIGGFSRQGRRRNLSTTSNNLHYSRTSPRHPKSGFGNLDELPINKETPPSLGNSKMIRSAYMRDSRAPPIELNSASLCHVQRLLYQLLEDANIPNIPSWEKALIPILLQCTDDVNPNVRAGDDIDIRHYVKLKKIPGGKPGATAYVSGVVFTKNLALKSMSRTISNPRIVIVSFPIEYQRHQHHFMSLEPVIAQEKEFLRNMVNRIASLRPQLLLVQKHVSGLALQYLTEANIAVAYNVKQSVIEAVSRCAQTEIISSIDMVALKPVHIGKCAGFDLKTYVHDEIPRKKKTYVYLSGCSKDLGCTIVLRGGNMTTLTNMKRITEFMVYVVYNLKLETCLMRDEFVLIPDSDDHLTISDKQQPSVISDNCLVKISVNSETAFKHDQKQSEVVQPSLASQIDNPQSKIKENSNSSLDQPSLTLKHDSILNSPGVHQLPEDIPTPTFYSDMVAKHQTKILSASPIVKFVQPYLLMQAREQERRLIYFKRLRDQDNYEEQTESEKSKPQKFQLIKPDMVHNPVKRAPRQIIEVLHAVHDAEYDKALHNYQTQKRQWENYLQGSLNLFEPYAHQNISVLYTVVCTATSIPCAGPELLTLIFYNEHDKFDSDCTLGQYVEDLCLSANITCASNGCERKMFEHHRTYVHGEARMTVFVEKSPCKFKGLQDSILMWSYCKICQKETPVMPMSENTWKYSLGKYLELSFWSTKLCLRAGVCPHDIHRDHLRYFGYRNVAIRIHYDPIDLLEIIVPRTRITWNVDHDLQLKNEIFLKFEEKWNRFMASVHSRIKRINIDSVAQEKAEACKAEVERLAMLAQEEHGSLIRKLQQRYMESKYYEIIPLNRAVREMQEKVARWDDAFCDFDANFFPSDKDIRRLTAQQLKSMFIDREESVPPVSSVEPSEICDLNEKPIEMTSSVNQNSTSIVVEDSHESLSTTPKEPLNGSDLLVSTHKKSSEKLTDTQSHLNISNEENVCPLYITSPPPQKNYSLEVSVLTLSPSCSPVQINQIDSGSNLRHLFGSSLESTLSESMEKVSRANQSCEEGVNALSETSGIPRPTERTLPRRSVSTLSPTFSRPQSQSKYSRRVNFAPKVKNKKIDTRNASDVPVSSLDPPRQSSVEQVKHYEKKVPERQATGTSKSNRKVVQSMIPVSIHPKPKDSKVSSLARHFEQLSREFEQKRLRDRKQRRQEVTQSRVFPNASSKPIVEVYEDVNEAVEERDPSGDDLNVADLTYNDSKVSQSLDSQENARLESTSKYPDVFDSNSVVTRVEEAVTENKIIPQNPSQVESDEECGVSDIDHYYLLDEVIPRTTDLPETLQGRRSNVESSLEIPKHEKNSLMKMLTNFWAERSASGWTPLEYPMGAGDHVFADVDVIVREDEPSSLIAFALQTQDYKEKLSDIRRQGQVTNQNAESMHIEKSDSIVACEDNINQDGVETSLLRATGTHLAYSFVDGSARMQCKIFFAEQFDAVRRKCGVSERIVESLSRCLKWDSKGGKTKSVFLKTLDDRLVLKSLSPIETAAFLKFAPAYFNLMAEALFHDLPTVIAKLLGFYQIIIKNPNTGTEIKWDILLMENLFYDRSPTRIFDLKGSMRNRKIQSTGEQNEVLLDENMVEFIYESPLFAREVSKTNVTKDSKLRTFSILKNFYVLQFSMIHCFYKEMM